MRKMLLLTVFSVSLLFVLGSCAKNNCPGSSSNSKDDFTELKESGGDADQQLFDKNP